MSTRPSRLLPFLAFLTLAFALPAPAVELWVSPDGSAGNAGTSEKPFASVSAAQRHGRELRRLRDPSVAEGVRIVLKTGVYRLDATLRLRPEDSGTAASPTVFTAAPGARPVFSGGLRIEGWHRPDAPVAGLPAAAQATVWCAPAPVFQGRPLEFRQLWVNESKATRARSPNGNTLARLRAWHGASETAVLPAAPAAGLRAATGVELVVQQQWEIAILRLKTLDRDGEDARVTFHAPESRLEFEHPWPQPILPPEGGGAFYLVNALEFLDEPGEWFHDAKAGRVYYWPRANENLAVADVIAPALEALLSVEGTADRPVTHVSFRGIAFQHSTWLRPSHQGHVPLQMGMYLTEAYKLRPKGTPDWRSLDNQAWIGRPPAAVAAAYAIGLSFTRCRFEHVAMTGLDLTAGVQQSVIEGCRFDDIGGNALLLGEFNTGGAETHLPYAPADARALCREIQIANNRVTDCGTEDWGCVGIGAGFASDVSIEHNEVSHVPYTAISLGWGWTRTANALRNNRVHANHLHHYATRLCDTAGVYTLSAQPGTIVSENVVHSVTMTPYVDRPDHWFYLYLDEGSSFIQVRDNWTPEPRFFENAVGPGNVWTNNGPQVASEIVHRAGLEPNERAELGGTTPAQWLESLTPPSAAGSRPPTGSL